MLLPGLVSSPCQQFLTALEPGFRPTPEPQNHFDMEILSVKTLGLTLLVLVCSLASCQWDEPAQPSTMVPEQEMTGGGSGNTGDDDEPIIQGDVTNTQANSVSSAQLSLIDQSTDQVVALTLSDATGAYSLSAKAGNYRLEVNAIGYQPWALTGLVLDTTVTQAVVMQ